MKRLEIKVLVLPSRERCHSVLEMNYSLINYKKARWVYVV